MTKVVLIGDSITEGVVAGMIDDRWSYANAIARAVDRYAPAGSSVVNLGAGGASSQDWHPSAWQLGGGHHGHLFAGIPTDGDYYAILLGANDAIGFLEPGQVRIPFDRHRDNLVAIVGEILAQQQAGQIAHVGILTQPNAFHGFEPAQLYWTLYKMASVPQAAMATGAKLLPWADVAAEHHFLDPDWLHPHMGGHRELAGVLWGDLELTFGWSTG